MTYPIVMKPWGMEIWFINTEFYSWKMIVCVHHKWSSNGRYHYHGVKDETFFVKSGILELDINEKSYIIHPQKTIRVKPYHRHRFRSITPSCVFYEVSTHHDETDSIRI
jgi:mannose-6-phosphate isomerase-like protein (cupin superfamily)